ncbi:HNH endonuclease signature motif containing protein [Micromonospora sp. NPDC053740]|uniref:HNH endonuclease signature motif containing protein n=1 Tax=Micromonospora sp. NPDC053740 TaxID=3155173 RepID=UPI003442076D
MGDATCCLPECNQPRDCRDMCKPHYEPQRRRGLINVRPRLSPEQRFWAKVNADGACWEWTASADAAGYGTFNTGSRTVSSHRYAWTALVGPVPDGLELDHLCLNRRCVFPDHLEPVTHAENVRRQGRNHRTHCPSGHRRATNRYASGRPGCRACNREANRRRYVPQPAVEVTHCKNGHEFTPENTYFQLKAGGRKSRQCRKCKVINQRRYEANRDGSMHDKGTRNAPRGAQAAA